MSFAGAQWNGANSEMAFAGRLKPRLHATPHSPPIPTQQRQQFLWLQDRDGEKRLGVWIF